MTMTFILCSVFLTMTTSNLNHTNLACKDYYNKYYLFHGRVMEKLRYLPTNKYLSIFV